MLHWSPEQVTRPAQLSPLAQEMRVTDAVLVMVEAQAEASAQSTVHSLPAQAMGPAQELPWPQLTVQAVDLEQSTPP
jgi:hypothetical protein